MHYKRPDGHCSDSTCTLGLTSDQTTSPQLTAVLLLVSPAPHLPLAAPPASLRGGGSVLGIVNLTVTILSVARHCVLDRKGPENIKRLKEGLREVRDQVKEDNGPLVTAACLPGV